MLRKECKNISDVLFAHYASICFIAAIEIPLQIFPGKASIYFGNIYLAVKVAATQLSAQWREEVFGKCLSSSLSQDGFFFPLEKKSLGLGEC